MALGDETMVMSMRSTNFRWQIRKYLSVVNERKINDAEHVELLGAINVRYSDRYIVHNAPRGRDLREIEFFKCSATGCVGR